MFRTMTLVVMLLLIGTVTSQRFWLFRNNNDNSAAEDNNVDPTADDSEEETTPGSFLGRFGAGWRKSKSESDQLEKVKEEEDKNRRRLRGGSRSDAPVLTADEAVLQILSKLDPDGDGQTELPPEWDPTALPLDDFVKSLPTLSDVDRRRVFGGNFVRGAFRGLGNGYRGVRQLQKGAAQAVNDAFIDTLNSINYAMSLIPYDDIATTANRVGMYFQGLLDSGIPQDVFDTLLKTDAGGAQATITALIQHSDDPETLRQILNEIAENYKIVQGITSLETQNFLAVLEGEDAVRPTEGVTDETVTDETVIDEAVIDENAIDENAMGENVIDENVTDESMTDNSVTDNLAELVARVKETVGTTEQTGEEMVVEEEAAATTVESPDGEMATATENAA